VIGCFLLAIMLGLIVAGVVATAATLALYALLAAAVIVVFWAVPRAIYDVAGASNRATGALLAGLWVGCSAAVALVVIAR